jgi:hypothetical protein
MATDGSRVERLRVAPIIAAILIAAVVISGTVAIVVPSRKTTTIITETSTETTIVSINATTIGNVGGGEFSFLTSSGVCTADGTYVPCLGDDAYIFSCNTIQSLLAGPSPASQDCVQKVTSTTAPYPSTNVTITVLSTTQRTGVASWANCEWSVASTPESGNDAYCIPVNSSTSSGSVSFIVGEPAPPPP